MQLAARGTNEQQRLGIPTILKYTIYSTYSGMRKIQFMIEIRSYRKASTVTGLEQVDSQARDETPRLTGYPHDTTPQHITISPPLSETLKSTPLHPIESLHRVLAPNSFRAACLSFSSFPISQVSSQMSPQSSCQGYTVAESLGKLCCRHDDTIALCATRLRTTISH